MSSGVNIFRRARVLKVDPRNPQEKTIKIAAEILKKGGLVAFPTETVYGLGADYSNNKAVEKLYKVKNRPRNKPLTLHVSDVDMLKEFVPKIPGLAQRLINRFWPGPLTIVITSKDGKKLGFRMPMNKIALRLIKECGAPLVVPSANPSGARSPKNANEVLRSLGRKVDMVLDGGTSEIGIESTVIDSTVFPCRILREGAISKARISET